MYIVPFGHSFYAWISTAHVRAHASADVNLLESRRMFAFARSRTGLPGAHWRVARRCKSYRCTKSNDILDRTLTPRDERSIAETLYQVAIPPTPCRKAITQHQHACHRLCSMRCAHQTKSTSVVRYVSMMGVYAVETSFPPTPLWTQLCAFMLMHYTPRFRTPPSTRAARGYRGPGSRWERSCACIPGRGWSRAPLRRPRD